MKTKLICAAALSMLALSNAALADEGMWLLSKPPTKLLKSRYNFEPTAPWLEHIQKSCVRFSTGGSGSIISADGLVMTNHHVGSDNLEKLSTPEHNLAETGFYAKTRDEELKCQDLELMVLWSIDDVTDRVTGAVTAGMSAADANTARRKMTTVIEQESEQSTGLDSQVVTLYQGGRYHLYRYKRYTDIRLVMAPEAKIAFFGGDNDNFEYPRYDLDMCFFRIYEDGKPLHSEHFLKWSANGSSDGELIFVAGHPGRTQRLFTVDHLKFLRDVEYPYTMLRLWRREVQMTVFRGRSEEFERIGTNDYFGLQNSRKATTGILAGLLDPAMMKAKLEAETQLRAKVNANVDYRAKWGDAWDRLAAVERTYRDFFVRYSALERRGGAIRSELFGMARNLVRMAEELPKPNPDRLREYRESELDSLELELYSTAPIYEDLEIERMTSGLSFFAESLGADDPIVVKALAGKSPRARAEALIRGTKLKDVEVRKQIAAGGTAAIADSTDPLIRLAVDLDPESRALRKRFEDEIEGPERDAYAKIAAAQFAINGEDTYPDATFTLRLAFGTVKGYVEDGKKIPPFTTLGGAFERMAERKGVEPFALPQRWIDGKSRLKLDTPFNFVATPDIIGGNSGSPVVNRAGELIGLIFDGNLQSLIWDIAYTDEQGRALAVDSRAIVECLRKLYDAGALADEMTRR